MKRCIISFILCLAGAAAFAQDIPVVVSHVEWHETFRPVLNFAIRRVPPQSARLAIMGPSGLPTCAPPRLETWSIVATNSLPYAGILHTDYLAEGDYILESWLGDGSYTVDKPYGFAKFSVSTSEIGRVSVELTEINSSIPRIDIVSALKLQDVYAKIISPSEADETALYNTVAESCTDRGYWAPDQLRPSAYIGLDTRDASSADIAKVRVRILRSSVNGQVVWHGVNFASSEPVLDTVLPVGVHDVITEADLFAGYPYADLDWGKVVDLCTNNEENINVPSGAITNVCYRIVLFDGTVERGNSTNNNLCVMLVNEFERRLTPVSNMVVRAYSGQPTFSWTHSNTIGKAYPAFQLRVWEEDGTTPVFDSGVQRAPARDAAGRYCWTPGDINLSANTTYLWSVSMLDAKWIEPINETKVPFMMQETVPVDSTTEWSAGKVLPFAVHEVDWRGLPSPSSLRFRLRKIASSELLDLAPPWYAARPEIFGAALDEWTLPVSRGLPLADSRLLGSRLPQGDYMLECWRGDGDYVVGEPYGCARFSMSTGEIGRVSIELTEINSSMPRIALASGLVDRYIWRLPSAYASPADPIVTDKPLTLEVWRTAVNGSPVWDGVSMVSDEPVLSATLPVGTAYISEADLLATTSAVDLDWGTVRQIYVDHDHIMRYSWGDITNVCYRIVLLDGTVDRANPTNNNPSVEFVNVFELGIRHTQVTNMEVCIYSGQPTFSWTHPNTIGKAYPAFQLRVWEEDGTTLVYDSDVQRAPARDAAGRYCWTPGDIDLSPNTTYQWSVTMLDAKFDKPRGVVTKVVFTVPD